MPGNDAEELLPVTAFEKVIKTTIRQAASPVTRQDMWEAYKAAIPGATVTVSPEGAMPWEGRGTRVISSPVRCQWRHAGPARTMMLPAAGSYRARVAPGQGEAMKGR